MIRDLIFYNNRSYDFLKDIYDLYNCRQIVIELKNVKKVYIAPENSSIWVSDGTHWDDIGQANESVRQLALFLTEKYKKYFGERDSEC